MLAVNAQDHGQILGVRLPATGLGREKRHDMSHAFSCNTSTSFSNSVNSSKMQPVGNNASLGLTQSLQAFGKQNPSEVRFSEAVSMKPNEPGLKPVMGVSLSGGSLRK